MTAEKMTVADTLSGAPVHPAWAWVTATFEKHRADVAPPRALIVIVIEPTHNRFIGIAFADPFAHQKLSFDSECDPRAAEWVAVSLWEGERLESERILKPLPHEENTFANYMTRMCELEGISFDGMAQVDLGQKVILTH